MGQFLQDGGNVCLMFILDIRIFGTMKPLSFDLGKTFGVVLGTLFLASLNDF